MIKLSVNTKKNTLKLQGVKKMNIKFPFSCNKQLLIVTVFLISFTIPKQVYPSHIMGGEIVWECTPQGNFRFIVKLYRDCAGINYPIQLQLNTNIPGFGMILLVRDTIIDISPICSCPGGINITCAGTPFGIPYSNSGAVEEHIYTTDHYFPAGVPLATVPPATGWHFTIFSAARNLSTNIPNSLNYPITLRASMYPYQGIPVNNCFDNSPRFLEKPSMTICTGYPYTYNHVAHDDELDSLVYEWAEPLSGNMTTPIVTYYPGYSFSSPLPDTMHHPGNIPATLNPHTGEISFTSYTNGAFITVVKVTAYKCGIKVAEIFREIQVVLLSCGLNSPPTVTPPFQDSLGQYTFFQDTVYAGQHITFNILATDYDTCPGTVPPVLQTIDIYAVGAQYGYPINQSGCLNPPCAMLFPTPTYTTPVSGQTMVYTTFDWQTECQHLATNVGCGITSNTYNFLFKVMDNFCPAPGVSHVTVTIVVLPKPKLRSPPVRCLKVLNNGDVEITWTEVVDTLNSFESYHLWSSSSPAGPFTLIDSIFDISITTATHIGAGANSQSIYYYLTVRSGCDLEMSPPCDTVNTIFLSVVNPGPGMGTAELTWNSIRDQHLPTSSGIYDVYRDFPSGMWFKTDSTSAISYIDLITACNEFISYRIEIIDTLYSDSSGVLVCHSVSNINGDTFTSLIPPSTPEIHVVTVEQNTLTNLITWNSVPEGDVIGYIIYQQDGGVNILLDTIWGRMDTTYLDVLNDPCSNAVTYVVQAFDSCWNVSSFSPPHNSLLVDVKQDPCYQEHVISWNQYNNMIPSPVSYEVWSTDDQNQTPTLLAALGAGDTTYVNTNLVAEREYCYLIRAIDSTGNKVSEACEVCKIVSTPDSSEFLYIKTATVEDNSYVKVILHTDISVNVLGYELFRSNDGLNFTYLATLPPGATQQIEYNDYYTFVHSQSYYYKAIVIDSCGNASDTSNIARTIYLSINTIQQLKSNILTWNDYEEFSGWPTSYNIWRSVDGVQEIMPVSVYPPVTEIHHDDVSLFSESHGQFSYYVEAIEGTGNIYGLTSINSVSNEVVTFMEPNIFIPSAFTPEKTENEIFKPVTLYVPVRNYEFSIFNRLGQLLFTTNNLNIGWDGTFNGKLVQEGVYVYIVRFTFAGDNKYERRGTVTLIR